MPTVDSSEQPATVIPIQPNSGLTAFTSYLKQRELLGHHAAHGITYTDRQTLAKEIGYPVPSDAAAIPYYNVDGTPVMEGANPYRRFRLLHAPKNSGKYRQPINTLSHAYFAQQTHDWQHVAVTTSVPIIFTEGELKALRANITPGFPPTVGLGGVDSFTGGKRGTPLLPELSEWEWRNRTIYIAYDADLGAEGYKPTVQASADRLASTFIAMGANVVALNLGGAAKGLPTPPPDPDDPKVGLDDYILRGGTWALLQLTGETMEGTDNLRQLLALYGIHRPTGNVVELATGTMWPAHTFEKSIEGHRTVPGEKAPIPAAKAFLASPKRAMIEHIGVWPERPAGLQMIPRVEAEGGHPREVRYGNGEEDERLCINLFKPPAGWNHRPEENTPEYQQLKEKTLFTWGTFVNSFFKSEPGLTQLFDRWVAQAVRFPSTRNFTSWILQSRQTGVGKSLLAETLVRMVGPTLGTTLGPDAFNSGYNYHLMGKLFVVFNEVADTRGFEREFRQMRTADVISYEEKYLPRVAGRNRSNFIVTTNEAVAFRTHEDERRDIVYTPPFKGDDTEWETFMREEVVPLSLDPARLQILLSYYRFDVELGDYLPGQRAPVTQSKNEMADHSQSNSEHAARSLIGHMGVEAGPQYGFEARGFKTGLVAENIDYRTMRRHIKRYATAWADVYYKGDDGVSTRVLFVGGTEAQFRNMPRPDRELMLAKSQKAFLEWLQTSGE